ncbi:hypothetical protein SKAU_G00184420 [Synaphobranchus kaupii]|uniref:Uncharacterized protein n=1 Tax=Synaphobranchus kaupii TaxID=118154 RepID=A0A9Q1FCS3_SYNKA|nr:hypothetical protein SKAU_G00184420 [Synaphobranchus kaupii]
MTGPSKVHLEGRVPVQECRKRSGPLHVKFKPRALHAQHDFDTARCVSPERDGGGATTATLCAPTRKPSPRGGRLNQRGNAAVALRHSRLTDQTSEDPLSSGRWGTPGNPSVRADKIWNPDMHPVIVVGGPSYAQAGP